MRTVDMRTSDTRKRLYASQKALCCYCQSETPFERFTLDHVLPKSKGGTYAQDNIVGACLDCNKEKGHTNSTTYAAYRLGLIPHKTKKSNLK